MSDSDGSESPSYRRGWAVLLSDPFIHEGVTADALPANTNQNTPLEVARRNPSNIANRARAIVAQWDLENSGDPDRRWCNADDIPADSYEREDKRLFGE